jgi:hypothetical protein
MQLSDAAVPIPGGGRPGSPLLPPRALGLDRGSVPAAVDQAATRLTSVARIRSRQRRHVCC